jgi:hypothetical protein
MNDYLGGEGRKPSQLQNEGMRGGKDRETLKRSHVTKQGEDVQTQ